MKPPSSTANLLALSAPLRLCKTLQELTDLGYRFISMGADVVGITQYCNSVVNAFAGLEASRIKVEGIYGR